MDKPRLPQFMRDRATVAKRAHATRPIPPRIGVDGDELSASFECPYADEDRDAWEALLFQAFGSRSIAVVSCFTRQLADFCRREWDDKAARWKPSTHEFNTVLAMVAAMKPRDEAQAAYAAQLAAVHLASMRLAERVTGGGFVDPRTVAVLAKASRAYGDGMVQMQRLQGRGRATRQSIKVQSNKHQHLHYYGGSRENGGQPHTKAAGVVEASATVPGVNATGEALPSASSPFQARLPDARRGKGFRGAAG